MNNSIEFVNTGPYPTRQGNSVRPLVDGIPAFSRICEAIEFAQHSLYATITFMWPNFVMPGGRGSALTVFENAAQRGIDVRLIFWRPEAEMEKHKKNAFWGSTDHLALLRDHYPNLNIRWDSAAKGYCQHQKSWLIDAGQDDAIAFVGGINLNPNSLVSPGHRQSNISPEVQNHDAYIELRGPSVADVHHNFVQRWNEASERDIDAGCFGPLAKDELPFPNQTPAEQGTASVQIQRTIHRGLYQNNHATPEGHACNTSDGEKTNLDQYCSAIMSAQRTIYIENQYIEVTPIVAALEEALLRGVEIIIVLPVSPDYGLGTDVISRKRQDFLKRRAALSEHHNLMLCGLATVSAARELVPIYVHSKLMIIDGEFATVGSTNLHHHSLYGNGELNAAIQDPNSALALLAELFKEHLGESIRHLDDWEAVKLFKKIARQNRKSQKINLSGWQGLAFEMDISTYGERDPLA